MVEKSDLIRSDIEQTRSEMGQTLDALGQKANVPARAKGWAGGKRDRVTSSFSAGLSKISGATDSMISKVSGVTPSTGDIQAGAGRVKGTAERNPLGVTLAGAALGFIVGLLAPSTRVEDEKLGPVADEVKSKAADAGQEALEHGKQVAQAAAQSAVETAKEEGKQHGEELSDSVQEKAREVTPSGAGPS
jgi:gas vesicle protein